MQSYVDAVLGPGHDFEVFYTNTMVKEAYKKHVETILNRTNTITGINYIEEPAILAIELANVRAMYATNRDLSQDGS